MTITLETPTAADLDDVVAELTQWQREGSAMQLHPGDLGWFWRHGATRTAAAVRTWRRDGRLVAVGLLDGDDLLRMTLAPDAMDDGDLAGRVTTDVSTVSAGVLPAGTAYLEAPATARVRDSLLAAGWQVDAPWTALRRDLADPVPATDLRVELVTPSRVADWAGVLASAFGSSTPAEERWHAMAAGTPYADARSLVGYDDDRPVAAVTVWSAGPGRPGLLEPMGVHAEHRGRRHGTSISQAAAATLRELGCSSAVVNTPSANVAGVATYEAAGFVRTGETTDRRRDA